MLTERGHVLQDVETEKEVWEGVKHENFVNFGEVDIEMGSNPPAPYATPRTGLSSVPSGVLPATYRSSPERSKSDLRMSPKTPISSLQRSRSTPLSVDGSQEGTVRVRSRPSSSKPHRPLQDQLNQIEDETEMIREQTELSHFTEGESKISFEPDSVKLEPQTEEIPEEKVEVETVEDETVEIKSDLEAEAKEEEPAEEEKKEVVEEREATPEQPPREPTPQEPEVDVVDVEEKGRGTPNECSASTFDK